MPRTVQTAEAVALCQELIRTPSLSGQEGAVAEVLATAMERLGFDFVERDGYGNVIGVIEGRRPGKTVLFDGHIDTVPVSQPERWTHPPFGAKIVDGRIYGRGASDMKGAVAAMTVGAALLARETDRDFAGRVCVAGVVHEECFEGIASAAISKRYAPDFVIIGEASELNLKIGQRGRAEIVVETHGRPAHSANPEKGVNAVLGMVELIGAIDALTPPKHPVLGQGILVLTDIISTPYPGASVVPARCRVTYDRRTLVGETRQSVLAPLRQVIDALAARNPEFKAHVAYATGSEVCYTGEEIAGERFFPAWLFDPEADFVSRALNGLHMAGLPATLTHYAFCTNGSHYAGERGIPTLGFGPSRENLAHTNDEYIELDQLTRAVTGYRALAAALLEA